MAPALAIRTVGQAIRKHLAELSRLKGKELIERRYQRFRALGVFAER
jgi:acetyl-CoA carboxylase carboxyl transferase subunit alpha